MPNQQIIESFLIALKNKDYELMKELFASNIQYFDPVYSYLKQEEVIGMWKMELRSYDEYILTWDNIIDKGDGYFSVKCNTSFLRNRKLINLKHTLHVKIENGIISEHSNAFSIHELVKQEKGFSGWLLGWNRYYQNIIKLKARQELYKMLTIHG